MPTVVPFVFGVVPDSLGLGAALRAARDAGLADPLPLRYAARRDATAEDPVQRRLVPDYQGTAIWTSLGGWYLALLAPHRPGCGCTGGGRHARADRARRHGVRGVRRPGADRRRGPSVPRHRRPVHGRRGDALGGESSSRRSRRPRRAEAWPRRRGAVDAGS